MKWLTSMVAVVIVRRTWTAHAQVVKKKALTLDGAKQVIAAAIGEARRQGPGRRHRRRGRRRQPDGARAARRHVRRRRQHLDRQGADGGDLQAARPRRFEDIIKNGRTAMVALPDFTPLQGGVPIVVDGEVVGGIGVSGAASAASRTRRSPRRAPPPRRRSAGRPRPTPSPQA